MRSLRFRLPALFLAGIVLAALVTALVALRLFQHWSHEQTLEELRRQAAALARLYEAQAVQSVDEDRRAPRFAARSLERTTGARLYYAGVDIFPGEVSGLRPLERAALDWRLARDGKAQELEFQPPGTDRTYLGVAHPVTLGGETFGALVVAKPRAELRERWEELMERIGLALLVALALAGALVWYVSRRLTEPLLSLSHAADRVAEGRFDTEVPELDSRDEIGHLAERFRDMTRRLAEVEELERNFLVRVSHELRTPLTAIRGHLEALREGLAEDPEARSASLDVLRAETDRLERLVGDVLDLARLETHQFPLQEEEVELRRLLEQAYQTFSEEARQRAIRFDRRFAADPVVHTDGDRVLQIVSNLLRNAFAWTPDGGRVALELAAGNGAVRVAVSDTGPGIAEPERERIFHPFWSGDGSGVGLGLAIARELAEALGGELELESEVGEGSRFELTLPAS